jgi:flagellar biosynthesis protein FlhA
MEPQSEAAFYKNIDMCTLCSMWIPSRWSSATALSRWWTKAPAAALSTRIVMFRKQFALEYGVVVPTVRLRDNGT